MPRIQPTALRDLASRLAEDGKLDKKDMDSLVQGALEDSSLEVGERAELVEILGRYADRIESPESVRKLEAFLQIADKGVRALADKLERDDGVIDAADADKLVELLDQDDRGAPTRAFSLGAVMIGAKLTPDANNKLRDAVDRVGPAALLGNLGDVEGETVVIDARGRLGLGAPPTDSAEEMRALVQLALKVEPGTDPFAGVTDPALLKKIAGGLAEAHADLLPGPDTRGGAQLEQRQGRAAALKLLESAALRGRELGDGGLVDKLATQLVSAAVTEPYRSLRDFALQSYDVKAAEGLLPAKPEATEAVFPTKPPYAKWLRDNTIKIQYVCDNDGTPISGTVSYFRRMGFRAQQGDDKSWDLSYPARGGMPALNVHIPAPPPDDGEPELFNKMDDDSVDMIVYSGHAGYGRRVDAALRDGIDGTGEGKLVVLLQCWGEGNLETLENAFPDAQVLSTTDSTTDYIDHVMFTRLLNGVTQQEGWDSIGDAIRTDLKDRLGGIDRYKDKDWDKQFFFPNSRELMLDAFDRDSDAVTDRSDPIFNVVYPRRLGLAGGYDPVVQEIPSYALDGSAFGQSLDTLSLVFRYEEMLPPDRQAQVPWSSDAVVSDGFFSPAADETRAFRFQIDGGKLHVAVSTRFAHSSEEDLTRMLALEAGLFLGEAAGLDDKGQVGLGLSMLNRALKQQGDWYYEEGVLDTQQVEEAMIFSRYGMEGLRFEDISKAAALGDHDHFTPATLQKVIDMVAARPGLADTASRAPTRVGTPVAVPDGVAFADQYLERSQVEAVVRQLGLDAAVVSFSPDWLPEGAPSSLAVTLRTADGEAQILSLGLDKLGKVQRAATIPLDLGAMLKARVADFCKELAQSGQIDAGALQLAYDQARAGGADVADAMVAVFRSARVQADLGTDFWADSSALFELLTPDQRQRAEAGHERLLGWGAQDAERFLSEWINAIGGVDLTALKPDYVAALAEGGLGKAFPLMLTALPDQVPPPAFSLAMKTQGWGLSLDASRALVEMLQTKTGEPDAALLLRAMAEQEWDAERDLVERLGRQAIDAGKGPAAVAIAVMEGVHAEHGRLPWFADHQRLNDLGLLDDAGLQVVNAKAVELGCYG